MIEKVTLFYSINTLKAIFQDSPPTVKSRRPEVFYRKGALEIFMKFTGKHLCRSLFFNKVAGLRQRQ